MENNLTEICICVTKISVLNNNNNSNPVCSAKAAFWIIGTADNHNELLDNESVNDVFWTWGHFEYTFVCR